jgi:hypothetical protein
MSDRTLPDFKLIASCITDRTYLADAFEELYYKGYYAGRIDEENEWWRRQNAEESTSTNT